MNGVIHVTPHLAFSVGLYSLGAISLGFLIVGGSDYLGASHGEGDELKGVFIVGTAMGATVLVLALFRV